MAFNTYAPTIYQRFTYAIAAGESIDVAVYGRFLTILSNSSATDPHVSIGGQVEYQIPAGLSVDLNPEADSTNAKYFGKLRFRNSTGAVMTIDFAISSGRIFDNRIIISTTTVLLTNSTGQTMSTPAKYAAGTGAPGAPAVVAASTTREVGITNNGTNPVWAGDANVDGANSRGILIPAGSTVFLTTAAAIYLRSTGGTSDCGIMVIAT